MAKNGERDTDALRAELAHVETDLANPSMRAIGKFLIQRKAELVAALGSSLIGEMIVEARKPKNYRVMWEFDVFDVATPREAAEQAFAAMQRLGTTANVFQVRDVTDVTGTTYHVDLDDAAEDHEVVA